MMASAPRSLMLSTHSKRVFLMLRLLANSTNHPVGTSDVIILIRNRDRTPGRTYLVCDLIECR